MAATGKTQNLPLDTGQLDRERTPVLILSLGGRVEYANQSALRAVGLSFAELSEAVAEAEEPWPWPKSAGALAHGRPLLGVRLHLAGRSLKADLLPIFNNGLVSHVICYPVAQPGETDEDPPARQLLTQLEALMDSSYDGLWITDANGLVLRVNKAALELLGVRESQVLGHSVADLITSGLISESVTQAVLRSKTTVTLVQRLKNHKKILVTGNPIFDEQGEITYVVINDRDITLLDRMRRQLEDSQARLEHFRAELSELQIKELESGYYMCTSRDMKRAYQAAVKVASSNATVLITGESGVGKGMLAKLIHQNSPRADQPFIRVDCAAIPESLFESEMFGYEPGAFTGADKKGKPGLIEMAHGGTLFLDEVAEINPAHQVKLLRFLDDRRLIRVGGKHAHKVDTRVVAATNKNLAEEVAQGRFRRDLFYRFNVVPLHVSPLRERPQDILGLIRFFVKRVCEENRLAKDIDSAARAILLSYDYPGNVRELENIVERVLIMSPGQKAGAEDLPLELWSQPPELQGSEWRAGIGLKDRLARVERELISRAVKRYGSQRKAARHLGISQSSIARKLAQGQIIDS